MIRPLDCKDLEIIAVNEILEEDGLDENKSKEIFDQFDNRSCKIQFRNWYEDNKRSRLSFKSEPWCVRIYKNDDINEEFPKIVHIQWKTLPGAKSLLWRLGIQIRNIKMVFKFSGTWRWVTFEKLMMKIYDFLYSAKSFSHPV